MNKTTNILEKKPNELISKRLSSPLRIPKSLSPKIIQHKYARAICLFLELKPLFRSSVILNDNGKLPNNKIAEFAIKGNREIWDYIQELKELKLIKVDIHKNYHLSSLLYLKNLLNKGKSRNIKTLKYGNNFNSYRLVEAVAFFENLTAQDCEYRRKVNLDLSVQHLANLQLSKYSKKRMNDQEKKASYELFTDRERITLYEKALKDYLNTGKSNAYLNVLSTRFNKRLEKRFCEITDSKKKAFLRKYASEKPKPNEINPFTMLSIEKIALMLGKSKSGAYVILRKLEALGFINVQKLTVRTNSSRAYEYGFNNNLYEVVNDKGEKQNIKRKTYNIAERPNFRNYNDKNYEDKKKQIGVRGYKKLFKTVYSLPNIITINNILTPYYTEQTYLKAYLFKQYKYESIMDYEAYN